MENTKTNKETLADKVVREYNEKCPHALRTFVGEDGVETYVDKKAVAKYYAKMEAKRRRAMLPKDRHLDMSVEACEKREAKRLADRAKPKKLTPQQKVKKEIMLAANKKAFSCGDITKHWNEDFLFDYATRYGIDKMLALDFDKAETYMLSINKHGEK